MIEIETAWGVYDTHGVADALVLDADGDTTISAPVDDQIDVEIAGADDFTFTANSFNVLSGSNVDFADDAQARFGNSDDYWFAYDSTGTNFELRSTNVDGVGGDGDIFTVQDGTNDVAFAGGLATDGQAAPTSGLVVNGDIDLGATLGNEVILNTDGAGHVTSMRSPADDQLYYKVNDVDMFKLDQSGTIGFQIENNNSKLMSIDYTGVGYVFQISNFGSQFIIRPRTDGNAFLIKDSANLNVLLINTNNTGGIPFDMTLGVNDEGRFIVNTFDNATAEDKEAIQVQSRSTSDKLMIGNSSTNRYGWIQAYRNGTGVNDIYLQELGGSVVVGGAGAIATTATDGFLYIPSCAGAPSGTPTDHSNASAIVHDTTNNRIYLYDHVSGAWQYAALT